MSEWTSAWLIKSKRHIEMKLCVNMKMKMVHRLHASIAHQVTIVNTICHCNYIIIIINIIRIVSEWVYAKAIVINTCCKFLLIINVPCVFLLKHIRKFVADWTFHTILYSAMRWQIIVKIERVREHPYLTYERFLCFSLLHFHWS